VLSLESVNLPCEPVLILDDLLNDLCLNSQFRFACEVGTDARQFRGLQKVGGLLALLLVAVLFLSFLRLLLLTCWSFRRWFITVIIILDRSERSIIMLDGLLLPVI
jgi:hypothetical protein